MALPFPYLCSHPPGRRATFSEAPSRALDLIEHARAAGRGNRLYPLTEKHPKCLLPVGNRPLITYQLDMLERAGFKECIVLVTPPVAKQVSEYLNSGYEGKVRCQVHMVNDSAQSGTADALRQAAGLIKTDFVVVSADVVTDVNILYMADLHRSHDSAATMLLSSAGLETDRKGSTGGGGGRRSKAPAKKKGAEPLPECNYIGVEPLTKRVVLYVPRADVDVEETLRVPKRLLSQHPQLRVHTQLEDAHVYFFSLWALKVLEQNRDLSSIQAELIPHLVKAQFETPKSAVVDVDGDCGTGAPADAPSDAPSGASVLRQKRFIQPASLAMSSLRRGPRPAEDPVPVLAYIAPRGKTYAVRVNTVSAFKIVNRAIASLVDVRGEKWVEAGYTPPEPAASAPEGAVAGGKASKRDKPSVGRDCVIGSGVTLGARSSVKRSVVGKYCKIGSKCRISNCVIMDHAVVEDGVNLTDTVLCRSVRVGAASVVEACEVGTEYILAAKTKCKKEQFSNSTFFADAPEPSDGDSVSDDPQGASDAKMPVS